MKVCSKCRQKIHSGLICTNCRAKQKIENRKFCNCGKLIHSGTICTTCRNQQKEEKRKIKICPTCGAEHKKGKRCLKCCIKENDNRKIFCSCGKIMGKRATTCQSCASHIRKGTYNWSKEAVQRKLANSENSHMWKGDNVGKYALHRWVEKRFPKTEFCEICKERPPMDLANKTGIYSRDLGNWYWLCRKCHVESDGRLEKCHKIAREREKKKIINCPHIDKKYFGNGMCHNCWQKEWRKKNQQKVKNYREKYKLKKEAKP